MTAPKEWDAAAYQRLSDPQFAWGQRVLARTPLRGDEAALDIGCGTGRLTAELAGRLPHGLVVALDQSANMIAEAEKNLAPAFGARLSFRCLDVLALDDRDAYDLVFSTATFHWVLDHDRLFQVIHRALRPGGRLVAQCGGAGNLERIDGVVLALTRAHPYAPYLAGRSGHWLFAGAAETAARLHAAGFTDVETSIEEAPTPFPTREVFASFVERIVLRGFLAQLPDEALRARFLDDVVTAMDADEPRCTLDYRRLNLAARKPV